MRKRMTKLAAALTALTALAIGGATFASAAHKASPPASPTVTLQPSSSAVAGGGSVATDGDNVQQGDQSAPDTASSTGAETQTDAADSASESSVSETGPSDGPGGYADTTANADTQQQGEN